MDARTEYGHPSFPTSSVDLAEMEFYLLRDLDYHLILHHPYRPLLQLAGTVGKAAVERAEANAGSGAASSSSSRNKAAPATTTAGRGASSSSSSSAYGLGIHADALGINSSKLGLPNFDMTSASGSKPTTNTTTATGEGQEDQVTRDDRREEEAARKAMSSGDFGLPVARVEEIDQDVVQMAW